MNCVRAAVIGIGNMGTAHANCLLSGKIPGMKLSAVCDISAEKLRRFSERNPFVPTFTDYRELLRDNVADSVIIAVPHKLHAQIATDSFAAGKNVLVEKPEDISVTAAKKLNLAAANSGKKFAIMFNQRTNPLYSKARDIVRGGYLGTLIGTVWIITNWYRTQNYYNSGDWRATWAGEGGGVLLNQAPHNLDIWQWICSMPENVVAFCDAGKYHNIEVEDNAKLFTRYSNGAEGVFITSTGEYPGTNRLEVTGDLGKIVLEGGKLKWWKLKKSARDVCRFSGEAFVKIDSDFEEFEAETDNCGHEKILRNFANSVLYGEQLIAPGEEGIYELMLSNAAYLSWWNGNKRISLPFDTSEFDRCLGEKIKNSRYVPHAASCPAAGEYIKRWNVNW